MESKAFESKHAEATLPKPEPVNTDLINVGVGEPRETLVSFQDPIVVDEQNNTTVRQPQGKKATLSDVLNAILPPREWIDPADGAHLRQPVSTQKAERDDVVALQMSLDEKLQERQARENGLCPVREELYAQCFDELIRQVTIERPERGLLLLRARDEVRMTIAAYQTLYKSSVTFGMRKTLQAERGSTEIRTRVDELEEKKKQLLAKLQEQKSLYDSAEKRIAEKRALNDKKMQEEKEFLKFQAQHLESFLKSLGQNPSS